MNIYGEKVMLRAIEPEDCDILRAIINDGETEYMLGGWSFPVSSVEQKRWIENLPHSKYILRTMIEIENKAVGTVILSDIDYKNGSAQVHIKLGNDCRRNGYGKDSINTIVRYAFHELRLHCVYAVVSTSNMPSQRLFEKCGFHQEGVLRDRLYKQGEYINEIMYSIINRQ